ncbi:SdiA-regulated domain-containing protein [Leucobacter massiliensis]|uniref:SdiA-regulated domain-containing protein n=1 Tax=Leucobacter massiliensis TaxID=1686285 RepID=UPI001FE3390A|nr:SdiA-regulated domain-containing protein [Leucobacter massiliensis]
MSQIDRSVSNHDVIPVLESTVFDDAPTARLAGGLIARDGIALPGFEREFAAHFQLRRKVYVEQTGQLSVSELDADGTDRDPDDARSVTFGVFENHRSGTRLVGVARLILRGEHRPLPIEEYCPDALLPGEAGATSVEVSRVIARHESAGVQALVQAHLFALMLAHLSRHRLGRTFAILEPWLERHVKGLLSISRLGEPRYIEHYLDDNVPIEVDVPASIERVGEHYPALVERYRDAEPAISTFGRTRTGAASGRAA